LKPGGNSIHLHNAKDGTYITSTIEKIKGKNQSKKEVKGKNS
jgi:hypothetical protein